MASHTRKQNEIVERLKRIIQERIVAMLHYSRVIEHSNYDRTHYQHVV